MFTLCQALYTYYLIESSNEVLQLRIVMSMSYLTPAFILNSHGKTQPAPSYLVCESRRSSGWSMQGHGEVSPAGAWAQHAPLLSHWLPGCLLTGHKD